MPRNPIKRFRSKTAFALAGLPTTNGALCRLSGRQSEPIQAGESYPSIASIFTTKGHAASISGIDTTAHGAALSGPHVLRGSNKRKGVPEGTGAGLLKGSALESGGEGQSC